MKRILALLLLAAAVVAVFELQDRLGEPGSVKDGTPRRVRRFTEGERTLDPSGTAERPQRRPGRRGAGAGASLTVELTEPPAAWYGRPEWTEADRKYASVVADLDVTYDPALGHGARELAHLYSVEDGLVPGEALDWLLLSSGAADWGVRQSFTATSNEGDDAIRERVRSLVEAEVRDGRPVRIGVGEAYELGAVPPRTIAVLLSRNELRLHPFPRAAQPGTRLVLSATLPPNAREPHLLAMGPDLEVRDLTATALGRRIDVPIDVGTVTGELWLELLATLPTGPTPLTQVVIHVGEDLPTVWHGHYPPDESGIESPEEAADLVYELLDADRERFSLPPLTRDGRLDAVARGHSTDMAHNDFFGHISPTTGSVGDRLADAGYRAVSYAENVARNSSLWSAEVGLMRSLGHRKNILTDRNTHVGVAAVPDDDEGHRVWLVTQVFSRPVQRVNVDLVREVVLDRIDEVREARGLPPLLEDRRLQTVADGEAKTGSPDVHSALERAEQASLTSRGAYAWVHQVSEASDVAIPDQVGESHYRRVGVGVFQDMEAPPGASLSVVVILAG